MFLRKRGPIRLVPQADAQPEPPAHEGLAAEVHARLLDEANAHPDMSDEQLETLLRQLVADVARQRDELLAQGRLDALVNELRDEIRGLGPLEALLRDPEVTEIMVNGPQHVFIERAGRLSRVPVRFADDRHLLRIIDRVVSRVGRRIDESSPMCDARLPDGSRVNAILPPLAIDGPCMTIRRFGCPPAMESLVAAGALTEAMARFLRQAVEGKLNVLVSGGTGSGKTTMLNALSGFIPAAERMITIEDAAELRLQSPHVIRLETRQPNSEGQGGITTGDLLRNALRMRPDRIIIGEVRGGEALAMLQAMNTGHEGSMTTLHANGARDALSRLETMVLMAGAELPLRVVREQVAAALDLVIQLERSPSGQRRVVQIMEIVGMEGETYLAQDIFLNAAATGIVPRCLARMQARGHGVPTTMFQVAP